MKKLLTNSTMALVLFSFFAISCEKEPTDPPAPAAPSMKATTTWTARGGTNSTVVKGDVEEGKIDATYSISPELAACNCNGTWTYLIDKHKNAESFSTQNIHNGTVTFVPHTWGTYKITIIYKCPDGSSTSVTVSITAK